MIKLRGHQLNFDEDFSGTFASQYTSLILILLTLVLGTSEKFDTIKVEQTRSQVYQEQIDRARLNQPKTGILEKLIIKDRDTGHRDYRPKLLLGTFPWEDLLQQDSTEPDPVAVNTLAAFIMLHNIEIELEVTVRTEHLDQGFARAVSLEEALRTRGIGSDIARCYVVEGTESRLRALLVKSNSDSQLK